MISVTHVQNNSELESVSPGKSGRCYRCPELKSASLSDSDLLIAFCAIVDAYTQALEKT